MDDNKAKALAAALSQIEKQFGKGSIMRLGESDVSRDIQVVSTGSLGLDLALGVDEGGGAAQLLHLGDDRQRQRGLARGFRPVDLAYPPAREPPDAEREVEAQRAGGYDLDVLRHVGFAKAHDRALAELFFDLRQRRSQRLGLVVIHVLFPCRLSPPILNQSNHPTGE